MFVIFYLNFVLFFRHSVCMLCIENHLGEIIGCKTSVDRKGLKFDLVKKERMPDFQGKQVL